MTKYEELCELAKTGRKNWLDTRNRCRQHMLSLVRGLAGYCQIPADKAEFFEWDISTGTYEGSKVHNSAVSAMEFDEDGFCHLGVALNFSRDSGRLSGSWVTFSLVVTDADGKTTAKLSENGKPYLIDFNDQSTCEQFYDVILREIKTAFTNPHEARSLIGFRYSPEVTEESAVA